MHVQTDTVSLSFSVSLVPVIVAKRESSTGPTGKRLMGLLLLKPRIVAVTVSVWFNFSLHFILSKLISIFLRLKQLGHILCLYFYGYMCLGISFMYSIWKRSGFKTTWFIWIYRLGDKTYLLVCSFFHNLSIFWAISLASMILLFAVVLPCMPTPFHSVFRRFSAF